MTQDLERVGPSDLALANDKLINKANAGSGVGNQMPMPKIPMLKINNKSEEKQVDIDGTLQPVKFINEGFLVTEKIEDNWETKFFAKELKGVILKRRFKIQSKMDNDVRYYSNEFDTWNEPIKVSTGGERLFEGSYQEAKEMFKTGINPKTKRADKSFDTFLVLYLNVDKKLYKFEWRLSSMNKWFDYEGSFSQDTFVRYNTEFILHQETTGDINYFWVEFKRGEEVNLEEQLALQDQLNSLLGTTKSDVITTDDSQPAPPEDYSQPVVATEITPEAFERTGDPVIKTSEERDTTGDIEVEKIPF